MSAIYALLPGLSMMVAEHGARSHNAQLKGGVTCSDPGIFQRDGVSLIQGKDFKHASACYKRGSVPAHAAY